MLRLHQARWPSLCRSAVLFASLVAAVPAGGVAQSAPPSRGIRIVPQIGHDSPVTSIAVTPDGRGILTTAIGPAIYWNAATGLEVRRIGDVTSEITIGALAADGRTVLLGYAAEGGGGGAEIWDLEAGVAAHPLHGSSLVTAVAFSADGLRVATGDEHGTLVLWDLETGDEVRPFEGHAGEVTAVVFPPDGRTLASASRDGTIRFWDLTDGTEVRRVVGEEGHGWWMASDARRAVSRGYRGAITVWDLDAGVVLRTLEAGDAPSGGIAVSSDGRHALAATDDGTVRLWDLMSGAEVWSVREDGASAWSVALSPDGRHALVGTADARVSIRSMATGAEVGRLAGAADTVAVASISEDPGALRIVLPDGTVRLVGTDRRDEAPWSLGGAGADLSPDGRRALSVGPGKVVRVWDTEARRELWSWTAEDHVTFARFSFDGTHVSIDFRDEPPGLWDTQTGAVLEVPAPALEAVRRGSRARLAGYSADRRRLFVTESRLHGFGGTTIYDVHTGQKMRGLSGRAIASSPDGRFVVTEAFGRVTVWDTVGAEPVRGFGGHPNGIRSVKYGPHGNVILTVSGDRVVRLWKVAEEHLAAEVVALPGGGWIVATADGLFDASPGGEAHLAAVRGLEPLGSEHLDGLRRPGLLATVLGTGGLPAGPSAGPDVAPVIGPSQLEVVGNYVGKNVKLTVDGVVLADGYQPRLPTGVSWKLDIAPGPARTLPASLEIAGCPVWEGEVAFAPASISTLIVTGCGIEVLRPESMPAR